MLAKKQDVEKIHTTLGKGTKIEGKLSSEHSLRIDGHVTGEIYSDANVLIGRDGYVNGNIEALSVVSEGHIDGNIKAKEHAVLIVGSVLNGDIYAASLEMEKGALFNGQSRMIDADQKQGLFNGKSKNNNLTEQKEII